MRLNEFSKEENISFWKNMFLVGVFFIVTPITLGISLFSLFSFNDSALAKNAVVSKNLVASGYSGVQVYASLPPQLPSVSGTVGASDARPEIIRQYLDYYNSPLSPYSDFIVQTSDKYKLDYRLITAIAQQESNLCKVIPPGSYNCWGWGINSAGSLGFDSFEEAIDTVSKGLKTQYLDKGYNTVEEIMSKYNPISPGGAWANGVSQFMSEME
ncbi:MAG TPA: hypothetical protein VKC53_04285 [Patescibacteria group bacterium]|nr:hypothetical protein [Patescibacteria group bacterium]